jgi:hypothetical protein
VNPHKTSIADLAATVRRLPDEVLATYVRTGMIPMPRLAKTGPLEPWERVERLLIARGFGEILDAVCRKHGAIEEEVCGRARTASVVRARVELWVEMRARGHSVTEIAHFFDRDHSTVIQVMQAAKARCA